MDAKLTFLGRGSIQRWLFDLASIPRPSRRPMDACGERSTRLPNPPTVLPALDEIEGYRPGDPDRSLYVRSSAAVTHAGRRRANRLGLLL